MNPWDLAALASSIALAGALVVALVNLRSAPRLDPARKPRRSPKVSVLIPARDEAGPLPRVLEAWSRVAYPDWELLVLDDHSTDATPQILERATHDNSRLRILAGAALLPGWLGKNWACHQLAAQATGEVLLFADADVVPAPEALHATLACMEAEEADAVSGFGSQATSTPLAKAVVPLVMEIPPLAFLPLRLASRRPEPSLAAAVGQWFAFRRAAYEAVGGHAAVRDRIVEDMALAARIKADGLRLAPALARDVLRVEMYPTAPEVWRGFAKNLSQAGHGGLAGFLQVQIPAALVFLLPWLLPISGRILPLLPLFLLVALRIVAAFAWKRPLAHILWHPVGSVLLLAIGIRSALAPLWPMAWKGRIPCSKFAVPS